MQKILSTSEFDAFYDPMIDAVEVESDGMPVMTLHDLTPVGLERAISALISAYDPINELYKTLHGDDGLDSYYRVFLTTKCGDEYRVSHKFISKDDAESWVDFQTDMAGAKSWISYRIKRMRAKR
jgi:hypothetical protein